MNFQVILPDYPKHALKLKRFLEVSIYVFGNYVLKLFTSISINMHVDFCNICLFCCTNLVIKLIFLN